MPIDCLRSVLIDPNANVRNRNCLFVCFGKPDRSACPEMRGERGENRLCELVQSSCSIFGSLQGTEETRLPLYNGREYIRYKQQKPIMNLPQHNSGLIALRQIFDLRACKPNVFLYRALDLTAIHPRTREFPARARSLI